MADARDGAGPLWTTPMTAGTWGPVSAEAGPWAIRAATSCPAVGAQPAQAEEGVNSATPVRNSHRRVAALLEVEARRAAADGPARDVGGGPHVVPLVTGGRVRDEVDVLGWDAGAIDGRPSRAYGRLGAGELFGNGDVPEAGVVVLLVDATRGHGLGHGDRVR